MKKSFIFSLLMMNVLSLFASEEGFYNTPSRGTRPRAFSNLSLELAKIEDAKVNAALQAESPASVASHVCQSPNMRSGLMAALERGHFNEARDLLTALVAERGCPSQLAQQVGDALNDAKRVMLSKSYSPIMDNDIAVISSMAKSINESNRTQTPRYKRAKSSFVALIKNSNSSNQQVLEAANKMFDIKLGRDK